LNDKGLNHTRAVNRICYTSHTLHRPGMRVRGRKDGLGDRG
jgi:hypothetical protein